MNTVAAPATTEQALVLHRVFDAAKEAVFRLWSDPSRVKEWWHPKGFTTTRFEMDFREGGAYRFTVRPGETRELPDVCVGTLTPSTPEGLKD